MIASASRLKGSYSGSETVRRTKQEWQPRAWAYYDLIGEVHDAGQFVAKGLSGLRLYVEKRQADGTWAEIDGTEGSGERTATEIWNDVHDPGGGRTRIVSNYGRQRVVAGESYLICTGQDDPNAPTKWEMVSTDELRPHGDGWERLTSPSVRETFDDPPDDAWSVIPGEILVFRMWRPHPRYSDLADSPLRAMVDTCEQIVLLAQALRNKTRNRLKGAGLFLVPDEISPIEPPDEEDAEGDTAPVDDTDAEQDPVLAAIAEALIAPIADEMDPSAVAPLMMRVPGETIPQFRLIEFMDSATKYAESEQIEILIRRLARGFDMPVELLLGIAMANHWNAWMIDRQTWKAHLQNYAEEMRTDFTTAFLWPQLIGNQVADFEDYRVGYDESEVVNNPDRSKDAKDLHDRFVINDEALREANGFNDSDAPDDAEIEKRITIAQAIKGSGDGSASGGGDSGASASEAPAEPSADGVASLDGAISLAAIRCRELAGSRIRTKAQKDPLVRAQIDGIPNRDVCSVIGGDEWLRDQGLTPELLVSGGTEALAVYMDRESYSQRRITEVCSSVERQAAAELFTDQGAAMGAS